MGWWPFSKGSKAEEKLEVDNGLREYYESVIQKEPKAEDAGLGKTAQERIDTLNTMSSFSNDRRQKSIKQIALDNCVEYERAYSKCLVSGSYFEKFTSCLTERTMYDKCKEMQTQALEMLGFASTSDDAQKLAIKMKADDLMIQAAPSLTITTAQDEEFKRLLEKETKA